jgi:hypothetical protein
MESGRLQHRGHRRQQLTGERLHVTDLRSRWMKYAMLRAETYVCVALEAR